MRRHAVALPFVLRLEGDETGNVGANGMDPDRARSGHAMRDRRSRRLSLPLPPVETPSTPFAGTRMPETTEAAHHDPTSERRVVCMKWGTRYAAEYVNRLYAMVRRHTTGELRFICMTDDQSGLREEVERWNCPHIDIPPPHNNRGWRKVTLFAERLGDLSGDVLYLDLDIVITDGIDPIFDHPGRFVIMPNPTQPKSGIGNTSVYRFRVGEHTDVLSTLLEDPQRHIDEHTNSQTYISRTLADEMTFLPPEWCVSFKKQCIPPWPTRLWKPPTRPEGARVVIFTGKPDPDEAARGRWPAPVHKKLYKRIRPASWVREHWRE